MSRPPSLALLEPFPLAQLALPLLPSPYRAYRPSEREAPTGPSRGLLTQHLLPQRTLWRMHPLPKEPPP